MGQVPRILIVDDSPTIRNILKVYLMQFSLEVLEADSGERALSLARLLQPQLIIADVNMPGMDGMQMLQTLRAEKGALALTPVVLLTAEREENLEQKGKLAGANAFIRKPVAAGPVIEAVRQFVKFAA